MVEKTKPHQIVIIPLPTVMKLIVEILPRGQQFSQHQTHSTHFHDGLTLNEVLYNGVHREIIGNEPIEVHDLLYMKSRVLREGEQQLPTQVIVNH